MTIVLLGYMASGKSVIGEQLSATLSRNFIDLDTYIENEEGLTISEIFDQKGVIYFRKKEAYYLREILNTSNNLVLSLGGGTPCYSNNMDFVLSTANVISVYLQATITTLSNRLMNETSKRPLLSGIKSESELLEFIGKHLFERRTFYAMAQHTVNIDNKEINQIIEDIVLVLFKNS